MTMQHLEMDLGLQILMHLGLDRENAEKLQKSKRPTGIIFYERDQSGLGYKPPTQSFSLNLDNIYAGLSAKKYVAQVESSGPKLQSYQVQNNFFIPTKMKKKPVESFSAEDLAAIIPDDPNLKDITKVYPKELNLTENIQKKRRKHHHSHQGDQN